MRSICLAEPRGHALLRLIWAHHHAELNNLEILGQFMYPRDTLMRLVDLARAGLLDLRSIRARSFPLEALPAAMEAAATADALECVVMTPS